MSEHKTEVYLSYGDYVEGCAADCPRCHLDDALRDTLTLWRNLAIVGGLAFAFCCGDDFRDASHLSLTAMYATWCPGEGKPHPRFA